MLWWISWLSLFSLFNNTVSMVSQINYLFVASMIIEWKLHVAFILYLSLHFILTENALWTALKAGSTLFEIQLLMDHTQIHFIYFFFSFIFFFAYSLNRLRLTNLNLILLWNVFSSLFFAAQQFISFRFACRYVCLMHNDLIPYSLTYYYVSLWININDYKQQQRWQQRYTVE